MLAFLSLLVDFMIPLFALHIRSGHINVDRSSGTLGHIGIGRWLDHSRGDLHLTDSLLNDIERVGRPLRSLTHSNIYFS